MNKIEDFTEGSVWLDRFGIKLIFSHIRETTGNPCFTCEEKHPYTPFDDGKIGFSNKWKQLKKVM
jgi:hypothetical protein